ncbi:HAD family hydrolase [Paenarthrobacter sp. NPDC092416]|uniref:HAD family hydrolase n=1 Tax=Paenarthrobacter sp. NPDC092416 TaxID=3364386 RepID=UPI0037FE16E4
MSSITVLFDASGTLVTPRRSFHELLLSGGTWDIGNPEESIQLALASMGTDSLWPEDEPDPVLRLKGWYTFLETAIGRSGGVADGASCLNAARSILDPANYTEYPDVLPCLENLRDNHRVRAIGLLSNFDPWLRDILDLLGLTHYFDHISISGETGYAKPDPQAVFDAASALDSELENTVLVGDSMVVDGGAARAAGIRLILIDRTGTISYPDTTVINNLEQVPGVLETMQ